MQLLISAVTWDKYLRSGMSQVELLAKAQELGCAGVEFRPFWQHAKAEAAQIKQKLNANNLTATYACNDVLLAADKESTLQSLQAIGEAVVLAGEMGAKILRINIAAEKFAPEFFEADWWREAVSKVLADAAAQGITIAAENPPDAVRGVPDFVLQALAPFNDTKLHLTYDTGNWLYAKAEPSEALSLLLDYIHYVHLKDIVISPDGMKHSHLGIGSVNVKGLATQLQLSGYQGPFVLEFPGGDEPEARVRASMDYLLDN